MEKSKSTVALYRAQAKVLQHYTELRGAVSGIGWPTIRLRAVAGLFREETGRLYDLEPSRGCFGKRPADYTT